MPRMALTDVQHITKPGCWVMFLEGGLANGIGGNVTIGTEVNSQKKLTTSKQAGACFKCGQCPGGIVVV